MPMQATTTTPLFAAALKPERSSHVAGGWMALAIAAMLATPLVVLAPEMLVPVGAAVVIASLVLTGLSVHLSRQRRTVQQVTLWIDQLEILTIASDGSRTLRRFDPKTVRLVLVRDVNEKTTAVRLRAGSDEMELGAFLGLEDRASFARVFGTALRKARLAA